jgi:hypothetical protein
MSTGDQYIPGSEELTATLSFNNLASGQFIDESVFLEFPEGYLNSYNSLVVKADCYDEIGEWTEANNEYTANFIFVETSPEIVSIVDVPDDHGGWVSMVFNRSPKDQPGGSDMYDILRLDKSNGEWVKVAETAATGISSYTIALPTVVDSSSSVEDYMSVFRVFWEDPQYTSCPDSGYSVDNLGMVAVLLQESSATFENSSIRVSWKIASSIRNESSAASFLVSRAAGDGPFAGAENEIIDRGSGEYAFADIDIEPGSSYRYRIEYLEEGDRQILFETESIAVPAMPLTLDQNLPNPFNPSTFINFYLPEAKIICLEIFDVSGRRVRVLEDGLRISGRHRVEWNGLDDSGSSCSSGVYFCRLKAGKEILSRKMVLMR